MKADPTYLIWTPRVILKSHTDLAIRFNITPMTVVHWPIGDEQFYAHLLRDIGIHASPTSWEVIPYRSQYHGNPEASDWRDRWKLNWRVTVNTDTAYYKAINFNEGYETDAFSASAAISADAAMHAFVIADFPSSTDAVCAQTVIGHSLDISPQFEVFSVQGLFWQLQVELGPRNTDYFYESSPEVRHIEELCREQKGWPTFTERVRVLG
jgi:hypothetical protein